MTSEEIILSRLYDIHKSNNRDDLKALKRELYLDIYDYIDGGTYKILFEFIDLKMKAFHKSCYCNGKSNDYYSDNYSDDYSDYDSNYGSCCDSIS